MRFILFILLILSILSIGLAQTPSPTDYVTTVQNDARVKAAFDHIDKDRDAILREWIAITEVNAPSKHEQERAKFIEGLLRKPNGEPRLFLKTGTATTSTRPARFALWTVGWIEGVPGTGIEERLSFACMITRGRQNDTGGGTCAQLIRSLLSELNQRSAR